jgi:hypothetical protein
VRPVHGDGWPYAREHSQIELPFLQVVDPSIGWCPCWWAHQNSTQLAALTGARRADGRDTLFVVSSDFTHYRRSSATCVSPDGPDFVSEELRRLDFGAIDRICHGDVDGFERYVHATGITVCGRGPITAFLHLCARRLVGEVAAYSTSLDVTGDYEHSVSYASLVFRPQAGRRGRVPLFDLRAQYETIRHDAERAVAGIRRPAVRPRPDGRRFEVEMRAYEGRGTRLRCLAATRCCSR